MNQSKPHEVNTENECTQTAAYNIIYLMVEKTCLFCMVMSV